MLWVMLLAISGSSNLEKTSCLYIFAFPSASSTSAFLRGLRYAANVNIFEAKGDPGQGRIK